MSKYVLGISLLRCDDIFGYDVNLKQMNSHYIVYTILDPSEFYDLSYSEYIDLINENIGYIASHNTPFGFNNDIIRNYNVIIHKENFAKLDILCVQQSDSGELIAVLKTPYLNILQRKWKKYYSKQQELIQERKKIKSLKYREIHGIWK
jgi:hypothetical protein